MGKASIEGSRNAGAKTDRQQPAAAATKPANTSNETINQNFYTRAGEKR